MPEAQNLPKRGLIMDGAIGSEQVDSSGEVLDVEGCDVSSLPKDGVLNYEHEGEQPGTGDFSSIVGKCILAKKIFKRDECENDRQRMYWDKVGEVPFIYGIFRLFDESDHDNARAAAAILRDQHAAGEEQILRLSIEGSTIEKEGNVLKRTMARNVALTRKPCNKTAFTGVLHDPKDKTSTEPKSEIEALFEDVSKAEPLYRKLTSIPFVYVPMGAPEETLAKALDDLKKMVGGVPGSQTGQAALEVPTFANTAQKGRAKAALRDYDPASHGPFKTYAKAQLPDASDQFIDYFSDLVDDMSLKGKLSFLRKDEPGSKRKPQQQDMFEPEKARPVLDPESGRQSTVALRAAGEGADKKKDYAGIVRDIKAANDAGDLGAPAVPPVEQLTIHKRKVPKGGAYFDEDNGVLYAQGQDPLKVYIPGLDDHEYGQILHNPGINAIHDRALDNWWALHKVAREGRMPPEILAWSALFSAMSPNTSVPLQELAYAHLVDFANKSDWDPTKELSAEDGARFAAEFKRLSSGAKEGGGFLPQFMHEQLGPHKVFGGGGDYAGNESGIWSRNGAKTDDNGDFVLRVNKKTGDKQKIADPNKPGYLRSVGLETDKWKRAQDYAAWHGVLHDLYRGHGVDARSISEWLNGMKAVETRPGHEEEAGSGGTASGFAPKTIRYLLGMAGMGNVLVPDTHFLRHVFGLMEYDPRNTKVKSILWQSKNEHLLQGIDRYYYANHPAVAWTREKMKQRFGEDPGEQALFPGFWLHWLTVAPHERMRGWNNLAHNGNTDHAVFFTQARRILDKYGVPYDRRLLKSEQGSPVDEDDVWHGGGSMPARCAHAVKEIQQKFGSTPAAFAYYSWMVPALMAHEPMVKTELLTQALRKALEPEKPREPRLFQNKAVDPGEVEFLSGPKAGQKSQMVHFADEGHHVIVGDDGTHQKLSPLGNGSKYRVTRLPKVLSGGQRIQAVEHGLPHLANSQGQQALLDGIDISGSKSGWVQSKQGIIGHAAASKEMEQLETLSHELREYSPAQRAAAFHLLAKNIFGLGQHVPTAAAFQHPQTGDHFGVQQAIVGGEHLQQNPEHQAHLYHMLQTGQLDKLAMMDMMLNNHDRHAGSYLLTPGRSPGIHLPGNGMSMSQATPMMPHYWTTALGIAHGDRSRWMQSQLHPEAAAWAQRLNPSRFSDELQRLGVPLAYRQEGPRRMQALQQRLARGNVSRSSAFFSPFMPQVAEQPTPAL